MSGGPSQTDTFDPKPGHANSGPFKPIQTAVPGMLLGPHLPKLAQQAKDLAIIRSMSSKEGDHGRATYYLRTGYLPMGAGPLPDARLAGRQRVRRRVGRAARVRQHLAGPGDQSRPPSARASSDRSARRLIVGERNLAGAAMDRAVLRCGSRISTSRAASAAPGPTNGSI